MTWAPGNRYGEAVEPHYLAITYTWGRWRLDDHEEPHIEALPIKGISWTVPRVSVDHFTARGVQNCLEVILEEASTRNSSTALEFVWLDIACIDQNPGSPDAASEIGRQAKIFSGACDVYIWLNTLKWGALINLFFHDRSQEEYEATSDMNSREQIVDLNDIPSAAFVDYLLTDPWFTSLWTLQEAYLCPEAFIMTKDVKNSLWSDRAPDGARPAMDLKTLLDVFQITWAYAGSRLRDEFTLAPNWNESALGEIRRSIEKSGLLELADRCPTALLTAARHRKTGPKNTTDRVYGIMQVFGLRLGKSRPGARTDDSYTLEDLEDELGVALMTNDPMLSQLHVYQTTPPIGKGWRVTRESRSAVYQASRLNMFDSIYLAMGYEGLNTQAGKYMTIAATSFSPINCKEDTCALFEGPAVPLQLLHEVFVSTLAQTAPGWAHDLFAIALDSPEPVEIVWGPIESSWKDLDQVERLAEQYPGGLVLLLGQYNPSVASQGQAALALIVVPHDDIDYQRPSMWRRAGLCTWKIRHRLIDDALRPKLDGQDPMWSLTNGILV